MGHGPVALNALCTFHDYKAPSPSTSTRELRSGEGFPHKHLRAFRSQRPLQGFARLRGSPFCVFMYDRMSRDL